MATAGDTSNPQASGSSGTPGESDAAAPVYRWPRGTVWVALGLLFVVTLVVTWAIWQQGIKARYAAIRARGEPVTFAELDAAYPVPPAGKDTTDLLLIAGNMLNSRADEAEWRPLPFVGDGKLPEGGAWPELELAQKFLAENASAFDGLHKAVELGCQARFDGVASSQGVEIVLRYASPLRSACRALCLEAIVRLQSGDLRATTQSLAAAIRLERALANEPLEISHLIRAAIFGMAAHETKRALMTVDFSDADLTTLQDTLIDIDFQRSLKTAFLGERVYAVTGSGNFGVPGSFSNRVTEFLQRLDTGHCLDLWADFVVATDLPWPQMLEESRSIAARCDARQSGWREWLNIPNPVMADMLVQTLTRAELTRRLLVVAIALERYRVRHGAAPADLATLVPEFLTTVPHDPTDDSPFFYQAMETGYVLYSKIKELPLPSGESYDAETGANPSALFRRTLPSVPDPKANE